MNENIIDASEALIAGAGRLPTPAAGATALALALGRVCAAFALPIEDLLRVARASHAAAHPVPRLRPA